jgi:hypothetical protein
MLNSEQKTIPNNIDWGEGGFIIQFKGIKTRITLYVPQHLAMIEGFRFLGSGLGDHARSIQSM